jgi:glycerol-3-phosphate dehydrogenase
MPGGASPLGAGLTQAELQYLVTYEWARTTEDILWRRTKLGLQLKQRERANVERALDALMGRSHQASARSAG